MTMIQPPEPTVEVDIAPGGPTGPQGPPGTGTIIVGSVANVVNLPDPASVLRGNAYIVEADGGLYVSDEGAEGREWHHVGRIMGTIGGLPTGGTMYQALVKQSNTSGDIGWNHAGTWNNRDAVLTGSATILPTIESNASGGHVVAGRSASMTGGYAGVVIGTSAVAVGTRVTAVGANSSANGSYSTVLGYNARALTNSTALGASANASVAANATAVGYGATATHQSSTAIGTSATTTAAGQVMLGRNTDTVRVPGTLDARMFSPEMLIALAEALGLTT